MAALCFSGSAERSAMTGAKTDAARKVLTAQAHATLLRAEGRLGAAARRPNED